MIKSVIENKPRKWHEILSEVLWAYQNSKCKTIGLTPYQLTYGQDTMLLMEIVVKSLRVTRQNKLEPDDHHQALFMELDSFDKDRLMAFDNIWLNKLKVA